MFSVAGNAKLGNFAFTVTDLAISLTGIPITISRSYDTLRANIEGDFGYGWSMSFAEPRIAETTPKGWQMQPGDRVYLTNPEGRRVGFTYTPTYKSAFFFGAFAHPAFTPDRGVTDKLTVKEGTYGVGGILGAFEGAWNPSQYVLTTRDGTVYEYIQDEGLQRITDPNGNVVTFTDTAITHSAGGADPTDSRPSRTDQGDRRHSRQLDLLPVRCRARPGRLHQPDRRNHHVRLPRQSSPFPRRDLRLGRRAHLQSRVRRRRPLDRLDRRLGQRRPAGLRPRRVSPARSPTPAATSRRSGTTSGAM